MAQTRIAPSWPTKTARSGRGHPAADEIRRSAARGHRLRPAPAHRCRRSRAGRRDHAGSGAASAGTGGAKSTQPRGSHGRDDGRPGAGLVDGERDAGLAGGPRRSRDGRRDATGRGEVGHDRALLRNAAGLSPGRSRRRSSRTAWREQERVRDGAREGRESSWGRRPPRSEERARPRRAWPPSQYGPRAGPAGFSPTGAGAAQRAHEDASNRRPSPSAARAGAAAPCPVVSRTIMPLGRRPGRHSRPDHGLTKASVVRKNSASAPAARPAVASLIAWAPEGGETQLLAGHRERTLPSARGDVKLRPAIPGQAGGDRGKEARQWTRGRTRLRVVLAARALLAPRDAAPRRPSRKGKLCPRMRSIMPGASL